MGAEQKFVARGLLLMGFASGLLLGHWTDWPWWCYPAMIAVYVAAIVVMACWDIWHERTRPPGHSALQAHEREGKR